MPRCQLGRRTAVTPLSPQLSPPCQGDVPSRSPGLLLAGGGGRQPAPRRPSVPAGEGRGCHIPVPVVVTSLSPWVFEGGWGRGSAASRSSRIPLSLPAALPVRCHWRGHLSPARGMGLVPQLLMGNRSLRQLPAPVTPPAPGGGSGLGCPGWISPLSPGDVEGECQPGAASMGLHPRARIREAPDPWGHSWELWTCPLKATSPGLAPLRRQHTLPINSPGCRTGNAEPPAQPPEGLSQGSWPCPSLTAAFPCRSKAEMGHTCRGTINLATANITVEDSCNFIISNGGAQTYHLKASSEVERQRWVTALELAKAKAVKMLEESGTEFLDPQVAVPSG